MVNLMQKEFEEESTVAANVVTAFLQKEHALVQQNVGGYPSIIQVGQIINASLPCSFNCLLFVRR